MPTPSADFLLESNNLNKVFYIDSIDDINTEYIKKIIKWNEGVRKPYLQKLFDYYDDKHPILERNKNDSLKNNRLITNHAKYITTIRVGYLLGKDVEYQSIEKNNDSLEKILEVYKKQSIRNLDKSLGRDCSIYGVAYEYIYSNEGAEIKSVKLNPLNVILLRDSSVEHRKLGAILYSVMGGVGDNIDYINVKFITDEKIISYNKKLTAITEEVEHFFGEVPIIEYKNNEDRKGDFESILTLIDAYNTLQSDRVNDKEQLVEAILVLYGMTFNEETIESIKAYRAMSAPPKSEGAEAEYLIKTLSEDQIQILKKDIENDIFKIAMTPNITDELFAGNTSGVALKFKLLPFEISIQDKENEMEVGLQNRVYLYSKFLKTKKEITNIVEPHKIDVIFNKSLPQNDLEISQLVNNLDDFIDRETLISQLSFVKDASQIIEKKRKETEDRLNVETPEYGEKPNKPQE